MASSELPLLTCTPSSIGDVFDWLNHIPKTLQDNLSCETVLPMCIFKLPQTLTSEKPDAYLPQHMGLGPIHRFRADLYIKTEQHKLVTAREVLKPYNITSEFETIVKDRLVDLVTILRCCYDLSFDVDSTPLAWVFAIDAVVLLDILLTVTSGRPSESLEDVIMLENQIPLVVLIELLDALNINLSGESNSAYITNLVIKFCETRSPLKFTTPKSHSDLDIDNRFHLLDCMYHMKVCHARPPEDPTIRIDFLDDEPEEEADRSLFSILDAFLEPFKSALNLPWDSLAKLIELLFGETATKLEIEIPSVSALVSKAKIEFIPTTGGIQDIEFNEEKLTFCLPLLELKSDSEVILRNLVAYEELMFRNGHLPNLDCTEYLDFMCGIIDNDKDVKVLREKNIILGDYMEDKEIAKLFNGVTRSGGKDDLMKSKLTHTIEKLNKYYGNVPSVKLNYLMKNAFIASWKIGLIVFAILGLLCMLYIGIREVYAMKDMFGAGIVEIPSTIVNNQLLDS